MCDSLDVTRAGEAGSRHRSVSRGERGEFLGKTWKLWEGVVTTEQPSSNGSAEKTKNPTNAFSREWRK